MIVMILISTIFVSSDSHSEHGKTLFEGWERPVFPLIEETCRETVPETIIEGITVVEPMEEATQQDSVTEKIQDETDIMDIPYPFTVTVEPEDTEDAEIHVYKITISPWKNHAVCGVLLSLHTDGNNGIYEVTLNYIPTGLYFTYIINNGRVAVLIDGHTTDEKEQNEVIFCVFLKKDTGQVYVHISDYVEKS